ncbi:MAG: UDP-N-acetylmuramoyl-L-alanyl-D-glutamate--2,6-diaminopimelate ligase [Pseudomonadota bacterium]
MSDRVAQGRARNPSETNVLERLAQLGLLDRAAQFGPSLSAPITGLAVDSRKVQPGNLFAALPGSTVHGVEFVPYAIRMGAAVVLTDGAGMAWLEAEGLSDSIPVLVSHDPRKALAHAAAHWFNAQPETMVAVTGTNGKTSVTTFLRQIWVLTGKTAVNFGTTGVEGSVTRSLAHTTPEPITLHGVLADLAKEGLTHAAMEASSHGIDQRRLDGVALKAAAFTHLSRDHLDYHKTMEAYAAAKLRLFDTLLPERATAVVNVDDPVAFSAGEAALARGCRVLEVGRSARDLQLISTEFTARGQDVTFAFEGAQHRVSLGLIGGFQAENVLLAAGLALATGTPRAEVFATLPQLTGVRGRMEHAATRANGAGIYVDYSHTPDSLETALKALRPHVAGRLAVVFGAGGDRDPGKRPLMGKAAADYADVVIVTDDNPRSEPPAAIRKAVMAGCPEATEIGDRAEAILAGVDLLGPNDVLLIAGKGHETGQIVGQEILPFDDAEQARVSVAALDGASV